MVRTAQLAPARLIKVGPDLRTCKSTGSKWVPTKCKTRVQMVSSYCNDNARKAAIMQIGALASDFIVLEDFMSYQGGVYSHLSRKQLGGHACH